VQESASEYREANKKVNECATICIYYIMETMDIPMHQLCILNITNMHFQLRIKKIKKLATP
jgi:hypothetical protein